MVQNLLFVRYSGIFFQKGILNALLRFHTGEKLFVCEFCIKKFSSKIDLSKHLLIRTDLKYFVFETCNKTFSEMLHLNHHLSSQIGKKYASKVNIASRLILASISGRAWGPLNNDLVNSYFQL